MIKRILVILSILNSSVLYAQTVKTDILVIGGSPSGVAAALQCARSKVKTILSVQSSSLGNFTAAGTYVVDAHRDIPSGIWGEFSRQVWKTKKTRGGDTTRSATLKVDPAAGASALKNLTDSMKNLTVYLNSSFTGIKKDGERWEVTINQDGKTVTVKARVIIDATEDGNVAAKAGAKISDQFIRKNQGSSKVYRTSVGAGEALPGTLDDEVITAKNDYPHPPFYFIGMKDVLSGVDNILVTESILPAKKTLRYLPLQLELGQGVGTVAAYCAFFKTTTKNLKVRIIQGELLDFKGYLLPFSDIPKDDPDWRAIQQVCATGLLKGIQPESDYGSFLFKPDSLVNTAEIRPVLTEIYTRAFLWFNKEKPGETFSVGNTLSLISDYTLTDPKTLQISLQRAWKTEYKFSRDFDLNRPVTRREFAVLVNRFLNPFARTVELDGRLMN